MPDWCSIQIGQGARLRICKWRGVEVAALGRLKCKGRTMMRLVWGAIPELSEIKGLGMTDWDKEIEEIEQRKRLSLSLIHI